MCKVVSNQQQLSRLHELMNDNLDIARGLCTKSTCKDRWQKIADDVNKLGPPYRKWNKWQRVWIDMKCSRKQKLGFNAELAATDNENLADIDEVVSGILQLDATVKTTPPPEESQSAHDVKVSDGNDSVNSATTERKKCKSNRKRLRRSRLDILEKHITERHEFQDKLLVAVDDISQSLRYIEYFQRKNYFLKKEKLAIYRQYVKSKQKCRKYKTTLKEQVSQMKNIKNLGEE